MHVGTRCNARFTALTGRIRRKVSAAVMISTMRKIALPKTKHHGTRRKKSVDRVGYVQIKPALTNLL